MRVLLQQLLLRLACCMTEDKLRAVLLLLQL